MARVLAKLGQGLLANPGFVFSRLAQAQRGAKHSLTKSKKPLRYQGRGRGGTGRRKGLKIPRWQRRVGSSPTARTNMARQLAATKGMSLTLSGEQLAAQYRFALADSMGDAGAV